MSTKEHLEQQRETSGPRQSREPVLGREQVQGREPVAEQDFVNQPRPGEKQNEVHSLWPKKKSVPLPR